PELSRYFRRQWWSCIVLWSNLIKQVAERERRTTATIEVHCKILKTMDIAKRRLPLDQYLYARAAVIRDNQLLIAVSPSHTEERILDNFLKAYGIENDEAISLSESALGSYVI
ncbi:8789_t:CDS:2, partial [Paraglomus occultum]